MDDYVVANWRLAWASNDGRWQEARALFQQAHEEYPNARTLRGIGMAAFEMRDYVGAYRALMQALASEERPLTRRQRRATQALLEETRAFIGRFHRGREMA